MKSLLCASFISVILFVPGCARRHDADKAAAKTSGNPESAKSSTEVGRLKDERPIGTATMERDGTIILNLRAEGAGGAIGDARLAYPKGDKRYAEVLKHLGGLKPGEVKAVPPWPDAQ